MKALSNLSLPEKGNIYTLVIIDLIVTSKPSWCINNVKSNMDNN